MKMKKIGLLLALALCVAFSGCSKDDGDDVGTYVYQCEIANVKNMGDIQLLLLYNAIQLSVGAGENSRQTISGKTRKAADAEARVRYDAAIATLDANPAIYLEQLPSGASFGYYLVRYKDSYQEEKGATVTSKTYSR